MARRVAFLTIFFLAALCVLGQQKSAPATPTNPDEKIVRAEAVAWFKAGTAKDAAAFASYYAPDARLFPPGGPLVSGKEQISAFWVGFFKQPGLVFHGGSTAVEVAKSGDMAYERGTFQLTVNDAAGRPATSVGKYVVVWRKQPDGKWKAYADIFNTDK